MDYTRLVAIIICLNIALKKAMLEICVYYYY
jgi:hypothetical protein